MEEQAKDVLSKAEIFRYTLSHGYVMGFKLELPNLAGSSLCQFYRRTLREVLACDKGKLHKEVAKRYADLPKPRTPVMRSWTTIKGDEKTEDSEDIKKYRDNFTAIFSTWKEGIYDSSVQVMAGYDWKTIDGLAKSA